MPEEQEPLWDICTLGTDPSATVIALRDQPFGFHSMHMTGWDGYYFTHAQLTDFIARLQNRLAELDKLEQK